MKPSQIPYLLIAISIMLSSLSCATIPKGVEAVTPFNKERFLGKWYEIARIDFRFERDLNNTTAEYSLKSDGTIKVENRGYNTKKEKWEQAIGKAKFVGNDNIAMLKVSFFGPFYSGYNVLAIDPEYKYALIGGSSYKYLWILSRDKSIPEEVKSRYVKFATQLGYHASELLWIDHDPLE